MDKKLARDFLVWTGIATVGVVLLIGFTIMPVLPDPGLTRHWTVQPFVMAGGTRYDAIHRCGDEDPAILLVRGLQGNMVGVAYGHFHGWDDEEAVAFAKSAKPDCKLVFVYRLKRRIYVRARSFDKTLIYDNGPW